MLDKLYFMKYNEDNKKQERKKQKEQKKRKTKKSSEHGGRSNGSLTFTSRKSLNEFT